MRGIWIVNTNVDKWRANPERELFPVVLQVQTINRCNGRCGMCPYPYTIHLEPREIMDEGLYTKIVQECASEEDFQEFVPMTQNEPLLDVKLEERIAEFKRIAKPHQIVEIVTNGAALTPARFQKLVESGLDTLTFSLSAYTETTFNKLIDGLSWEQVTRNLDAVARSPLLSRVNVFLRYVRQQGNEVEFPVFKKYWQKKGLNVSYYEINNRAGSLNDYDERIPFKSTLFKWGRKGMGRKIFKGVCPYAFGVMHVLKNGDVHLCANDWQHREKLGNAREQSLREIYNSPRIREIRELMEQGRFDEIAPCKECSFWKEWLQN